jgi:hypothetical protein
MGTTDLDFAYFSILKHIIDQCTTSIAGVVAFLVTHTQNPAALATPSYNELLPKSIGFETDFFKVLP